MKYFSMLQNFQCIYEYALEDFSPNLHNGVLEAAWMRDVVRKKLIILALQYNWHEM